MSYLCLREMAHTPCTQTILNKCLQTRTPNHLLSRYCTLLLWCSLHFAPKARFSLAIFCQVTLTFSNVLAPPLMLLLIHDLVTCYVVMNINQVPQTGVVGASNLASTYGLGNYGTYGSAALNGALYGSSLPFLPSVFYRTRF